MLYPKNIEAKIGFDQIRLLLKGKCLSTLGEELVDEMAFGCQYDFIMNRLEEIDEFIQIIQENNDFPDQHFMDMREALRRIRIEGMYLDVAELFDLRRSAETISQMARYLHPGNADEEPRYPALCQLASHTNVPEAMMRRIHAVIDKYGHVKDNASDNLLRIRRELASTSSSISHTLNSILRAAQAGGVVDKDAVPTMRDGRLVIPVAPALKRKIKGIVHDESATGRTVYVEPTEVVDANNYIRQLEGEERREIVRILTELSAFIRPLIPDLLDCYVFMAHMDLIRAKALLAMQMKATRPQIVPTALVDWGQAIHPLLDMSLQKHGKKAIPLDIALTQEKRILIISGPNAGGKSVCLKTVALLQYMMQCGLYVPMHERSRMGLFKHVFIDIGDEQSIDDDLSTYSSHLTNMKAMVKGCSPESLVLIDEFGSGTEPHIGGAIAEAVLNRLNDKRTFGVITTHYHNLKQFANNHEGVVNGAMLYDRQAMRPLFQLLMGDPGSSFAIEIARKIGLPEDVIAEASEIVGQDYINADKYLQDIVRDRRYWETKRQQIHKHEKQLQDTITKYEAEITELESKRKEILRQAQSNAEQLFEEANAKIENTIRTIRESQAEKERTRQARNELKEFSTQVTENAIDHSDDEISRKMEKIKQRQERKAQRKEKKTAAGTQGLAPREKEKPTWAVGMHVVLKGQSSVGEILAVDGKMASVRFGIMKTNVALDRLAITDKPLESGIKKSTFVSSETRDLMREKKLNFKQDIDVRGMRGDEALQAVTYFIDDAIQVGMQRVRILHGTGTGILKVLIRQYLATVAGVAHFKDEHVEFGGAGITVVDLK